MSTQESTFLSSFYEQQPAKEPEIITGTFDHEDCTLHYYHTPLPSSLTSTRPPLITFIPGGSGHGLQYHALMLLLASTTTSLHATSPFTVASQPGANRITATATGQTIASTSSDPAQQSYTCLTFDRRQMSASQVTNPKPFSHPQQARDVASLIKHLGYSKSIIFGSSLGGAIAYQFCIDFPDMVDVLITHEAPLPSLVPNSTEIYEKLYLCNELYKIEGIEAAQEVFRSMFLGYGEEGVPANVKSDPRNEPNFWEFEFWTASVYCPDLRKVRKFLGGGQAAGCKRRVAVLAGERSRDDWFADGTKEQAGILGCERWVVPGHHSGFDAECEAFEPVFRRVLGSLEIGGGIKEAEWVGLGVSK